MSTAWDEAGQELQNSRLYVHSDAEAELAQAGVPFSTSDQSEAESVLDNATTSIRVAVLPQAAHEDITARDLAAGQDEGTFIILYSATDPRDVVGSVFSYEFNNQALLSEVEGILDSSRNALEFVEGTAGRLDNVVESDGGAAGSGTREPSSGGGGLVPLGILVAAGGGGFLLYRRSKRNRELAELTQVRSALDEDITAYGERLSELDLDVQADSKVPIEARREYGRALDLYENAKLYADRAEKPMDMKAVTNALEEGRWLLGCVDARAKGEPLPERRAPCFFDPRHGPSVKDVMWRPTGGVNRQVPVCAADAIQLRAGHDPEARMVDVNGERRPYWDAGPAYGAWAAGYYGAMLPAMMAGTLLGTTLAGPMAYGAGTDAAGDGGDFGGGFDGGGDFGGGFGGGDFGGGFDGGF